MGLTWELMAVAGILSGLLGIGSGALKVLAMDRIMRLPFKVSTTTSNFMIGVTAAVSASIYLSRGYIDPGLAMPVILGVLVGAFAGSRLFVAVNTAALRVLLAVAIGALAVEMIVHGLGRAGLTCRAARGPTSESSNGSAGLASLLTGSWAGTTAP